MSYKHQLTAKQEELAAKNELFRIQQMEGTLPKIKGNVDNTYEMLEAEKNHWHILIIKKIHNAAQSRYDEIREVQILNTKELGKLLPSGRWDESKGVGKVINNAENKRILHNPFLAEEVKAKPEKAKKEEVKGE